MKTLFLCRHAKSSWEYPELSDFERPLNARGHRDAEFMAKVLAQQRLRPDLMVASPAARALTTARMIAAGIGYPLHDLMITERLYDATSGEILQVATTLPETVSVAMLFGHNPGMTLLANQLGAPQIENIPTCGIVRLESTVEQWSQLAAATVRFVAFEFPKKYLA
ncbi:MAG: histidine phosphatase family protein [Candidatus Kapabacteria bacterium]|nr:histidine phosphatase family protein [Candidatus Kapabacteria bacterium]